MISFQVHFNSSSNWLGKYIFDEQSNCRSHNWWRQRQCAPIYQAS